MRTTSAIVVLCASLGWAPAVTGQGLEFGVRYWEMKPDGTALVGSDGNAGTSIDVKDDLGYGSKETIYGFDAALGSAHQVLLSYFALDASARNELDEPITFGAITFPAGVEVRSSIDADFLRAAYRHELGGDAVRGGLVAGLQWVDLESAVEASGLGRARAEANAVFPVVGVQVRAEPSPLVRLDLGVSGGVWDWNSTHVTFWDAEAGVRVNIYPFFIGFGYRHIAVDAQENGIPLSMDFTFRGPQFMGGFVF